MGSHWNPMLTSWNITIQLTSHDDLTEKSANGYHRKQKRFAAQFFSWNRRVSKYILTSFSFSEQIYLYDCSNQSGWHMYGWIFFSIFCKISWFNHVLLVLFVIMAISSFFPKESINDLTLSRLWPIKAIHDTNN